jgi:hypothetical protein
MVAVMAQAGYAGNPRYLVTAAAVGCALAGVGAARVGELAAARRGALAAASTLIVVVGALAVPYLLDQREELGIRADRRQALPQLVAAAGGRDALLECSRVRTWDDMRPLVAWELDLPMLDLDEPPVKPAVLLRARPHDGGPVEPRIDPAGLGYRLLARAPGWEAWAVCGPAPQTTD